MRILSFIFSTILAWGIDSTNADESVKLFNGNNLDNWNLYVPSEDVNIKDVFRVEDGHINISGIPDGYIRTKESYRNYKLHVEWRWPEEPKNSGILIHTQGEDRIFPHSIECQLKNGHAGDIVLIGAGAGITIKGSQYLLEEGGKPFMVIPKFAESSEHPAGDWNDYDIISRNGRLEVYINRVLQNIGTEMTLREGNIAIQSEGGPMQLRNIYLIPLDESS